MNLKCYLVVQGKPMRYGINREANEKRARSG